MSPYLFVSVLGRGALFQTVGFEHGVFAVLLPYFKHSLLPLFLLLSLCVEKIFSGLLLFVILEQVELFDGRVGSVLF